GPCPTSGPGAGRAPAASALLPAINAFPLPSPNGLEDAANGIGQFIGSWSNPSSIDSTSVRFDHIVNDKLRLFFRFSNTSSSSVTRGTYAVESTPTVGTTSFYTLRTYTAGAGSIFSSRLSNQFRLNYSSNEVTSRSVIDAFGGSTPVNLAELTGQGAQSEVQVGLLYGPYFVRILQQQQSGAQRQWNLVDTVNLSLGRHQFKFGVDYRRLAPFAAPYPSVLPYYYGLVNGEKDVETNTAFVFPEGLAPAYPLYKNFSAFAQDEWRISSRLSLSLGLRWDVNPAPGVTQGLKPYTLQGSNPNAITLAPQGTPLWQTTWFNLAPRLGAAYVLRDTPDWETVIRGGGGVFFDTGQQLGSLGFQGVGFVATLPAGFALGSFPTPVAPPVIVNPPVAPYGVNLYGFTPHLQLPYTLQWNTSVEQGLGNS